MAIRVTPQIRSAINQAHARTVTVRPYAARSANIVYKPKRRYKRRNKAVVAKPFRLAYHTMQPSKEKRFTWEDVGMFTSGTLSQRTEYEQIDAISQGALANQRLGSKLHISYVHIKGTALNSSLNTTKGLRIMLFREINNGGFDTTTFNFLFKSVGTTTSPPGGTQTDLMWTLNREMVQPIFDKTVIVPPKEDGAKRLSYKIRVNKLVKYQPMNSGSASPFHGRLFLVVCMANLNNTTDADTVTFSAGVRVFFKDGKTAR